MPESVQAETQLCLMIKIVICEKLGNYRSTRLRQRGRAARLAGQVRRLQGFLISFQN
jgi:hypothetical protein